MANKDDARALYNVIVQSLLSNRYCPIIVISNHQRTSAEEEYCLSLPVVSVTWARENIAQATAGAAWARRHPL